MSSFSKTLRALGLSLPVLLALALLALSGCGGGGGVGVKNTKGSGKVTFTVTWPQTGVGRNTRVIPIDTQSIVVSLKTIGNSPVEVGYVAITRPTQGYSTTTTTSLSDLPAGKLDVTVKAYAAAKPQPDAVPLAVNAPFQIEITANASKDIPITLNSTVTEVDINAIASASLIPGQTLQLSATAYDKSGGGSSIVPVGSFAWSSSNSNVVTVDAATGLATAVGLGQATITVTESASGQTNPLTLTITTGDIFSIAIHGASPLRLSANQAVTLTADVLDKNKYPIQLNNLQWSSDAPNVVDVQSDTSTTNTHSIRGLNPGTARITVSVTTGTGVHNSLPLVINVGPGGLATLSIAPAAPNQSGTINANTNLTLTATGADAGGNPVVLSPGNLTWDSTDKSVATVTTDANGNGVVHALLKGQTNITVTETSSQITSKNPFTVTVRLVVSVTPIAAITFGQTVQCKAVVTGSSVQDVTWALQPGSLGTINATTGVYQAPSTPTSSVTYYVIATSKDDPTQKSDPAPIVVQGGTGTITVQ